MFKVKSRCVAGLTAILFYLLMSGYHILDQNPHHVLWVCHVGCLIIGVGILTHQPRLNAAGFLWLVYGVPMWLVNLFTGAEWTLLSTLTHIGGLICGVWGLKQMGMPRFSWLGAVLGLFGLVGLSRIATPREANVNLAFDVWKGWESYFPSHFWYLVILFLGCMVVFIIVEGVVRKYLSRAGTTP